MLHNKWTDSVHETSVANSHSFVYTVSREWNIVTAATGTKNLKPITHLTSRKTITC